MTWQAWLQLAALVGLVVATAPVLGAYVARVFSGGRAPGDRIFLPVERAVYRVAGVDPQGEQPWAVYALSVIAFSAPGVPTPGWMPRSRARGRPCVIAVVAAAAARINAPQSRTLLYIEDS